MLPESRMKNGTSGITRLEQDLASLYLSQIAIGTGTIDLGRVKTGKAWVFASSALGCGQREPYSTNHTMRIWDMTGPECRISERRPFRPDVSKGCRHFAFKISSESLPGHALPVGLGRGSPNHLATPVVSRSGDDGRRRIYDGYRIEIEQAERCLVRDYSQKIT